MADALERVTNLLTLLLETRGSLTMQQIANELRGLYPTGESALRGAFERDKALLRDIGVPIETEVLGGDMAGQTAYRLDRRRYELSGLELDDDERHALQVAVAASRSDAGQEGVWKLGGSVLGSSAVAAEVPELEVLPVLRTASSDRRAVSFGYHGSPRTLEPYGLLLRSGLWYVIGRDVEREAIRTYRVDRIEGEVTVGADRFERPDDVDLTAVFPSDPKFLGEDQPVDATVRVDADRARAVRHELGESAVLHELADGSIEFAVPHRNPAAFRSWVLGLGAHAEVIGPADVREGIVAWLRGITEEASV